MQATENMTNDIPDRLERNFSLGQQVRGDLVVWLKIWQPGWAEGQPLPRAKVARMVWNQMGLRATLLYRLSHFVWRKHIPVLPGILSRLNLTYHGLDVPCSVAIGPGLYIPHPVGTVIMARYIGANLSLISAITIGMRNEQDFPVIGDNVFVGAGARILGGIHIGDNVSIGANAVVVKDVPAHHTAVGVPAVHRPKN